MGDFHDSAPLVKPRRGVQPARATTENGRPAQTRRHSQGGMLSDYYRSSGVFDRRGHWMSFDHPVLLALIR